MNRLGVALVFLVGVVVGFLAGSVEKAPMLPSAGSTVEIARVQDGSNAYTVNAEYPQFGIPAVDSKIAQTVSDAISQFKKDAAGPLVTSAKNEFDAEFDSAYLGRDIMSVRLLLSSYTGGAHPNSTIVGLTFDRLTGRVLTLDDALALIGSDLHQVAARSSAELKAKLGNSMFQEGVAAKPENYGTFTVNAGAVTFYFQNYQVASYADGPQQVSFPRE